MTISNSPNKSQFIHPKEQAKAAWAGAFWKVVSCACFAGINGIVRALSGGAGLDWEIPPLPSHMMLFFQNLLGAIFLLPLLWTKQISLKPKYLSLHSFRILTAVAGIYFWYLALESMPIAQAVSLSFLGPIFTVIAARFFLQEYFTQYKVISIGLSFVGAFLITRPDRALWVGDTVQWAAFFPLCSALLLAINKLTTRKLASKGEPASLLALYLLIFMTPLSFFYALADWIMPSEQHMIWLVALGLLSAVAHMAFSKAYALAEVGFLTPFGFSKFFLSAALGFFAFHEFPEEWSMWFGTLIIFASILLLHKDSELVKSRKK